MPGFTGFLNNLKNATSFQLKFTDRAGAGNALGIALKLSVGRKKNGAGPILILAIPRGGVIVGDIVAKKLGADFDVIISRKITSPDNKENAIGAVLFDGSVYLDGFMVKSLKVSSEYIENEKSRCAREIVERTRSFRPASAAYKIKGRTVVLIDDGIATGATVIATARWIRKQEPEKLVIAAPVGQPQAVELLKSEADLVEVLSTPSNFSSVNQFYQNFDQATDDRVIEILRRRNLLP